MSEQEEFLKRVEAALNSRVGGIVARSLLKINLATINKNVDSLTVEDYRVLFENIVKAVTLFETQDESKLIAADLESLLK